MFRPARLLALFVLVLAASQACALSVYFMGNSYTLQNDQRSRFPQYATAAGFPTTYCIYCILGAPLNLLYDEGLDHPDVNFQWETSCASWPQALSGNAFDALVVQPYNNDWNSEAYAAAEILKVALRANPRVQLYIYGQWSDKDSVIAGDTMFTFSMQHYYVPIADYVAQTVPQAKPPLIIPVGPTIFRLYDLIKKDSLPNVTSIDQLYAENDYGHLSTIGSYAVMCSWFAGIYRTNPSVFPDTLAGDAENIPAATANVIKSVVWQTMSTYSRSGIRGPSLSILNDSLYTALVSRPYQVALSGTGGTGRYTWSISAGALPAGLSLDPSGVIAGTPTNQAAAPITVRLADDSAGHTPATKQFTLHVVYPAAPQITNASLAGGVINVAYSDNVNVAQGYGTLTFSLGATSLPPGLQLNTSTGSISGTPTQKGSFTFTVTVTDQQSRSAGKQFTVAVTDPPVNGLHYDYYAADTIENMPDFDHLMRYGLGTCPNFTLAVRQRDNNFGLVFTGYLQVPRAGQYIFTLASNNGSVLLLDGDTVVNNSALSLWNGLGQKTDTVANLTAGRHPLKLEYYQVDSTMGLEVSWQGPGVPQAMIPDSVLFLDNGTSAINRFCARPVIQGNSSAADRGITATAYGLDGKVVASMPAALLRTNCAQTPKGMYIVRLRTLGGTPVGEVRLLNAGR